MAKWIEYTGSDGQINEMCNAIDGYILRLADKSITEVAIGGPYRDEGYDTYNRQIITHYLICQPHPYLDEIRIWADTGCEVWVREPIDYAMTGDMYKDYATDQPNWNIPNAIFRLTPFED